MCLGTKQKQKGEVDFLEFFDKLIKFTYPFRALELVLKDQFEFPLVEYINSQD